VTTTVWTDPVECPGAGQQIIPRVFSARGDGTWAVKEDAAFFATTLFGDRDGQGHGPAGPRGIARVPDLLLGSVLDAAEQGPGECIHLEVQR
jgi:ferredoxin